MAETIGTILACAGFAVTILGIIADHLAEPDSFTILNRTNSDL